MPKINGTLIFDVVIKEQQKYSDVDKIVVAVKNAINSVVDVDSCDYADSEIDESDDE
jgi:hypothetical protein